MANRILVTGAAGFIASHLIEHLLSRGNSIIGLDNFDSFYSKEDKLANLQQYINQDNFYFYEIDICDREKILNLEEEFDFVIHIAAKAGVRPSIKSPSEYIKANIDGTQNILDLMVKKECKKLLFSSSSSIYGNNTKVPFSEKDNVDHPISPYAFTKKANELQIHSFCHLYNIDAICLRFFTVYGPRQRPDLAIRKFIEKIEQGESIDMYGDGSTGRDYTYVSDIVSGIHAAYDFLCQHEEVYEIINLGNNKPILLKEMINTIYSVLKKPVQINQLPMQPGDVLQTCADISKAQSMLGYKPKVSFKKGIEAFVKWYRKNKE